MNFHSLVQTVGHTSRYVFHCSHLWWWKSHFGIFLVWQPFSLQSSCLYICIFLVWQPCSVPEHLCALMYPVWRSCLCHFSCPRVFNCLVQMSCHCASLYPWVVIFVCGRRILVHLLICVFVWNIFACPLSHLEFVMALCSASFLFITWNFAVSEPFFFLCAMWRAEIPYYRDVADYLILSAELKSRERSSL